MKSFGILLLLTLVVGKTILLSNDDSWVSSEIRALYDELKDSDYKVIMVAPVNQRSHYGGSFIVPSGTTLEEDGAFGYVKEGDSVWGHDDDDKDMWYFDGSPAACVGFAFDYLLPNKYPNVTIDMVIAGVNQGPNLSPGFFTSSGTMGATTAGIYRGYPGVSFSGSSLNSSFFKDNDGDQYNPSNIYAQKAVQLIDLLFDNDPVLPKLTGLNVNFPEVGYLLDDETKCVDPVWKLTALMSGGIFAPTVEYDNSTKEFSSYYEYHDDLEGDCQKGDTACNLPNEYNIFWARNCTASVSVFTVNYGADSTVTDKVKSEIDSLFKSTNSKRLTSSASTQFHGAIL